MKSNDQTDQSPQIGVTQMNGLEKWVASPIFSLSDSVDGTNV